MSKTTSVGSESPFRDEWIEGAARAFFVMAYADFVEDYYNELEDDVRACMKSGDHLSDCDDDGYCNNCGHQDPEFPRPGGGEDWMDFAPETPLNAYALAGELWGRIGALTENGGGVYALAHRAELADGKVPDADEFGHNMAMMTMGTGASWFDDHKDFPCKIPYMEVSAFSFDESAYAPTEG